MKYISDHQSKLKVQANSYFAPNSLTSAHYVPYLVGSFDTACGIFYSNYLIF